TATYTLSLHDALPILSGREPPVRHNLSSPTPGARGAARMMSRFPRRADAVLFVALSLVTAALSAAAVVGSLASVGRTFPGFVVRSEEHTSELQSPYDL